MEDTAAPERVRDRIPKPPRPPAHPDGLYDTDDCNLPTYTWSMPRLPRYVGRSAALLWGSALWVLGDVIEPGIHSPLDLEMAIGTLREVRALPADTRDPKQLFEATYYAALVSLEVGLVPQARRLWREAMDLSTRVIFSKQFSLTPPRYLNGLSLLAIRLNLDQPGWPLWGPVVLRNPRRAMPAELDPQMKKLLYRRAQWYRPALILNAMWGRLLATAGGDPEAATAIAGYVLAFASALVADSRTLQTTHLDQQIIMWMGVKGEFERPGPYTGLWARSEGGEEEDDPALVPRTERARLVKWIEPHN